MRWLALLVLLPLAGGDIIAVVPDLSGPGPGDEGFALSGSGSWAGWTVTDGETTWALPDMPASDEDWFYGAWEPWAAHDGPPGTAFGNALRLGNDGDELRLIDPTGRVTSAVEWGDADATGTLDYTSPDMVWRWDGDGDQAGDWLRPRAHRMGESDWPRTTLAVDAVTVYVSPDSSFEVLTGMLAGAKDRVALHVYELRSQVLVDHLVDVAERGIPLDVLVEDRPVGQERSERFETAHGLQRIEDAGGAAWLAQNDRYRHHHLKVLIVDDDVAIQSENWVASGVPADPSWGNRGWGIVLHGAGDWFWDVLAADRDAWDTVAFRLQEYAPDHVTPGRFGTATGTYAPRFDAVRLEGPFEVMPVITPEHTADPETDPVARAVQAATRRAWTQQLDFASAWTGPHGWSGPDPLHQALAGRTDIDARIMAAPPFHREDTGNAEAMASTGVPHCTFATPGLYLHNKGVIADDTVYIGSMNGNQHSRAMNREVGVLVTDPAVADYYAQVFLADWAHCEATEAFVPAPVPILLLVGWVVARRWTS